MRISGVRISREISGTFAVPVVDAARAGSAGKMSELAADTRPHRESRPAPLQRSATRMCHPGGTGAAA